MKYIAVLKQSGGCDYTIGCGIEVIEIDETERSGALDKLDEIVDDYKDTDGLESITLYEISSVVNVPLDNNYVFVDTEKFD